MNELKFNSAIYTSVEQSQRLLDLGLKPETVDMVYTNASLPFNKDEFHIICKEYSQLNREVNYEISPFIFIPAWSLHRLIEILPSEIKPRNDYYNITFDKDIVQYEYYEYGIEVLKSFGDSTNIYGNIIDCMEWLIKEGYFNQEYLKQ